MRIALHMKLLAVFLIAFFSVSAAAEIQVQPFKEGSIWFNFSNAQVIQYEGQRAFSVEVSATTDSWILPKEVALANMKLLFYMVDKQGLSVYQIGPKWFTSSNLAGTVALNPSGPMISSSDTSAHTAISGVILPKGASIAGSLVFMLPDDAILIHGIRYYGGSSIIRAPNYHIKMDTFSAENIAKVIYKVDIATDVHIRLVAILQAILTFENLNEDLATQK